MGIDGVDEFRRLVVRFEESHDDGLISMLPSLNANANTSLSDVAPRILDDLAACNALAKGCYTFLRRVEAELSGRLDMEQSDNSLAATLKDTRQVLKDIESAITPLT